MCAMSQKNDWISYGSPSLGKDSVLTIRFCYPLNVIVKALSLILGY